MKRKRYKLDLEKETRICKKCGRVGKFKKDWCSICIEKEKKRQMYKSVMPRFNVVSKTKS